MYKKKKIKQNHSVTKLNFYFKPKAWFKFCPENANIVTEIQYKQYTETQIHN